MKEDENRLKALRAKDAQAYQELISELGDSLYNVAFRIVKNPEKAREVVQEALLKMVKSIDRFEGRSSLKTWLYRITVNEALMAIRKELPRLDDPIEDLMPHFDAKIAKENLPDWAQDPEKLTSDAEFQSFYTAAVDELPETLRTAYILKDVDGLSENEICEILGITKSAVKNRAHRARLILKDVIGERYGH